MNLSPEILEELKTTDSISRRKEIVDAIEERTQNIIEAIVSALNIPGHGWWWAWSYYESDDPEPSFDIHNISDNSIIYSLCEIGYRYNRTYLDDKAIKWDLANGFPIQWLWDDNWKKYLVEGIDRFKQKEKEEKEFKKTRKEEIKKLRQQYSATAKAKLTPEELWATGLSKKIPKTLRHLQDVEDVD